VLVDERLHQQPGLRGAATSELDEVDSVPEQCGDFGGILIQNGVLGARDVVLRQFADLLE